MILPSLVIRAGGGSFLDFLDFFTCEDGERAGSGFPLFTSRGTALGQAFIITLESTGVMDEDMEPFNRADDTGEGRWEQIIMN